MHETDELASRAMVRFALATGTGEVIVEGDQAELAHPLRTIIPRKLEREERFLADAGFAGRSINAFAFEEGAIEVGMTVAVYGVARVEVTASAGETGFRDAPTTTRIVGDERHPLTIGPA